MKTLKEVVVHGVVNTELNAENWLDAFIDWLESRKEYFGGGVHDYVESEEEHQNNVYGNTIKDCKGGILLKP